MITQKNDLHPVRNALRNTGVFVHSAINHAHWRKRFTSAKEADAAIAAKNLEHCIRVSHAAGGSGVLLVMGASGDGPIEVLEERVRTRLNKILPLAGTLGQSILFENVWNGMHYKNNGAFDQTAEALAKFIDTFNSPLIGSYLDIGNHHRYGDMAEWIRTLGHRIQKFDLKGYHKGKAKETGKNGQWRDITEGDIKWAEVRKAIADINFSGWFTAEVGGGNVKRLTKVREQMQKALIG